MNHLQIDLVTDKLSDVTDAIFDHGGPEGGREGGKTDKGNGEVERERGGEGETDKVYTCSAYITFCQK